MISFLKDIYCLIPNEFRKKTILYLLFSFCNIFLDLLSIAYLIPIVVFIIDKDKMSELLTEFDISISLNSAFTIYSIIGILIVIFILKNIAQVKFNTRLFAFLHKMASELSTLYVRAFLKTSYLDFQKINKGEVFQEVLKITTHFSVNLVHSVILLLTEAIFFTFLLLTLGYFYPEITLIVILGLFVFSALIYYRKRLQIRLINSTYRTSFSKVNTFLINILDGYHEIRSSGRSEYFIQKFNRQNKKLNKVTAILVAFSHNYSKYLEICMGLGLGALVYTNFLTKSGDQIILVSLIGAFGIKIIPSLTKVLNALTMVNSHSYSIKELQELNQNVTTSLNQTTFQNDIVFREICFKYRTDLPLIDQLSFSIKKGEITAIKGVSGIGKTTLLHIVAGFIEPQSGSLRLDGTPQSFKTYSPSFSYVTQQPFLFHGSLLDNIIMGQEKELVDREYISFLIKKLELQDLVEREEKGLNTVISHNTPRLSGGQKQRFAIARALYKKPDILILDEATNQQNLELEKRIYKLFRELMKEKGMAVITVTHSENALRLCDHVLLLEEGKLEKEVIE